MVITVDELLPGIGETKVYNNNIIIVTFDSGIRMMVNVPDDKKDILTTYCSINHRVLTEETLQIFLHRMGISPNKRRKREKA